MREVLAVERRLLPSRGLLTVAVVHNDFWRPLDEQHFPAIGRLVQRRHELVLGLERNGVDARIRLLLRLALHAELVSKGVQRPLGRVSLDLPDAFRLEQFRVVAEHRHAPHQIHDRVLASRLTALFDLTFGCVAVAADLVFGFGRGYRHHHHLHQRQCACFVGADP